MGLIAKDPEAHGVYTEGGGMALALRGAGRSLPSGSRDELPGRSRAGLHRGGRWDNRRRDDVERKQQDRGGRADGL